MSFLLTVLKICATLQSISQTIANSHNFVDRNYIFKDNKQTKNIKANKKLNMKMRHPFGITKRDLNLLYQHFLHCMKTFQICLQS